MKSLSELLCQSEVQIATYEERLKLRHYIIPFDCVTTGNLNDIFPETKLDRKR